LRPRDRRGFTVQALTVDLALSEDDHDTDWSDLLSDWTGKAQGSALAGIPIPAEGIRVLLRQ